MTDEKPMDDREIVEEILHLQAVENQLVAELKGTILASQSLYKKLVPTNIPPDYVVAGGMVYKVVYETFGYGLPGSRYLLRPVSPKSVILCDGEKQTEPS